MLVYWEPRSECAISPSPGRRRHVGGGVDAVAASTHDFLTRAHDVTAAAMAHGFHWRNMLSSVLPVEPEAAALGAAVMAGAMRHEADGVLMEQLNLPLPALAPLFAGRAIAGMAS